MAHGASITQNTNDHSLILKGSRYEMQISYDNQMVVTSLKCDGNELLGDGGIYSGLKTGSKWVTSERLETMPKVCLSGSSATVEFTTPVAEETWTLTAEDDRAVLRMARKVPGGIPVSEMGQPVVNFARNAVEHVRWAEDGGNWPVLGNSAENIPKTWFAPDSPDFQKKRQTKQQISFALLNGSQEMALRVDGTSSFSGRERGEATVVQRMEEGQLRFYILSADGLRYAGAPPELETLPYTRDGNAGGVWPWKPVALPIDSETWVELAFAPAELSEYYELGEIKGLDGEKLSAFINEYARFMMVDRAHGAYVEHIGAYSELVPCEYHWLTQIVDTFEHNKGKSVAAFQGGLNDIRDHARDPETGHVWNLTVAGDAWGNNNSDNELGYVLSVCNIFNLSGDKEWLLTHRDSVRLALGYTLAENCSQDTNLVLVDRSSHAPEIHSNSYMENAWWQGWPGAGPDGPQNSDACIGGPHGTTSAMLYNAFVRWADLEEHVFGSKAVADKCRGIAGVLRENFLKSRKNGGCWLPDIDAIALSSTTAPVRYMPAIAEALKGDLLPPEKARAASRGYLDELLASDVTTMLVHNLYDLGDAKQLSDYTHLGTDGGFYGCTGGDAYACFVHAGYRDALLKFTHHWLNKDIKDWFRNEGYWLRDGSSTNNHLPDRPKVWMVFPSTAGVAWGLQYYGFGFQPQYDHLLIAPFIASPMIGSRVKYTYRDVEFEVEYLGLHNFRVVYLDSLESGGVFVRFVNQTANRRGYEVKVNGKLLPLVADARGNVDVEIAPGVSVVELISPDAE